VEGNSLALKGRKEMRTIGEMKEVRDRRRNEESRKERDGH
jgi:hypothetical protein